MYTRDLLTRLCEFNRQARGTDASFNGQQVKLSCHFYSPIFTHFSDTHKMRTNIQCSPDARLMLERYSYQTRSLRLYNTRVPYRRRTKPAVKLTSAEKAQRKQDFADHQELKTTLLKKAHDRIWEEAVELSKQLAHTPAHWYEYLMHTDGAPAAARDINLWNVYLSIRSRQINNGMIFVFVHLLLSISHVIVIIALPKGTPKYTQPQISKMVSPEWKALTKEEQNAITAPEKVNIEKRRESRKVGSHNVPIASHNDFRKTMDSITTQVNILKFISILSLLTFVFSYSISNNVLVVRWYFLPPVRARIPSNGPSTTQPVTYRNSFLKRSSIDLSVTWR